MTTTSLKQRASAFLDLCKPRVVALIVFTAMVGMALSTPGLLPLWQFVWGSVGIAN